MSYQVCLIYTLGISVLSFIIGNFFAILLAVMRIPPWPLYWILHFGWRWLSCVPLPAVWPVLPMFPVLRYENLSPAFAPCPPGVLPCCWDNLHSVCIHGHDAHFQVIAGQGKLETFGFPPLLAGSSPGQILNSSQRNALRRQNHGSHRPGFFTKSRTGKSSQKRTDGNPKRRNISRSIAERLETRDMVKVTLCQFPARSHLSLCNSNKHCNYP